MPIRKLESTNAFVVVDLDGAERSVGVVRLAPKILVDGAETLARSTTYAFASFSLKMGGASAGINTPAEGRDEAIKAFVAELAPAVEAGELVLSPGLGLEPADLEPFAPPPLDPALTGRAAVAAAAAVTGDLSGVTATIVGSGAAADAASTALTEAGAELTGGDFDTESDLTLVAGKAGVLDHETAEGMRTRAVVPLSPVPVTPRALAVLGRAGAVVVPDFLVTAAPLLATFDAQAGDPVDRVRSAVADVAGEGTGAWMAAAVRAEDFLRTWREDLPFGRPLP